MGYKKLVYRFLIYLLFLMFTKHSFAQEQLDVSVATISFPPYIASHLPENGWAWEVVKKAFAHQGATSKLRLYPWARAMKLVENVKVDALLLANKTQEREQWALFSDVLGKEIYVAWKLKSNIIDAQEISETKGKTASTLRASSSIKHLETIGFRPERVNTFTQGLMALKFKRVDFFVADKIVMTHMISNIPNEDKNLYDNLPVPLYSSNMHMLVAKKQPKAVEIIERFKIP
jgi:polar amino acid transport system substrate-binding protein